jgi:hypothetical protein
MIEATILNATRAAALAVLPELPPVLVYWEGVGNVQGSAEWPEVTIRAGAQRRNGKRREFSELRSGKVFTTYAQEWLYTCQIQIEGWQDDNCGPTKPARFAREMASVWETGAVKRALCDELTDEECRSPIGVVFPVGDVLALPGEVGGHSQPRFIYDVTFQYVTCYADPIGVGVINSVVVSGTVTQGSDTINTSVQVDR